MAALNRFKLNRAIFPNSGGRCTAAQSAVALLLQLNRAHSEIHRATPCSRIPSPSPITSSFTAVARGELRRRWPCVPARIFFK
uniref:Uncharacterized protein n=1 Tax=Arundo donax TaxID=35708 RepID=A0A0A8Y6D7_ARUDO